jgi:hypothetical protein
MGNILGLLCESLCDGYFVGRLRWRIFLSSFARASLISQYGNNSDILRRVFYCIFDVLVSD